MTIIQNKARMLSFETILFFIFLILKLTNQIDWSWWMITAPLWLPLIAAIFISGLFCLIMYIIDTNR